MSFAIFTDTSANLTGKLIEKYKITVIPLSYFIGGTEFTLANPDEFDGESFYRNMSEGMAPTTSQINPQRYMDYMTPALEAGEDILYIGMSSGISGSYASSRIAVKELREKFPDRNIRTVDTKGASLGEGLQVIHAARLRDAGMSLDGVWQSIKTYRDRMYQVITVDDLMHLKRGGRVSSVSAVVGTVLGIKPLLKGDENGKLVNFVNIRGRKKAIKALFDKYNTLGASVTGQTVGIAHAAAQADAEYLAQLLRNSENPPADIITVYYEPVTGSHAGPGTLALFFEGEDGVRHY